MNATIHRKIQNKIERKKKLHERLHSPSSMDEMFDSRNIQSLRDFNLHEVSAWPEIGASQLLRNYYISMHVY